MGKIRIFALFILLPFFLQAQKRTGLSFDDPQYNGIQGQATLIRGDFTPLPLSATLKQFCPKPLSQRMENTSPGWATAYGARTILEARRRNITDPKEIRSISFSPVFNYFMAKPEAVEDCSVPVKLPDVLESMKFYGVPKYVDFRKSCPTEIQDQVFLKAAENRITDYYRLFNTNAGLDEKIETVKRSLSKGSPVIIGMNVGPSLENVRGEFWQPREVLNAEEQPGHALVVVGYDDTKFTGAFEVMNSWGSDWGNEGFMWIRYKDFAEFTRYAFELFVLSGTNPDAVDLAGEVEIPLLDGSNMGFNLMNETAGYYKTSKPYGANTEFRILVTSLESSFVYIIGSDQTEEIYALFPEPGISAALPYKNSHVILPNEEEFWYIDEIPGVNYLCIVFSKEELWMTELESKLNSLKGKVFKDKIAITFHNKAILPENVEFESDKIRFEGTSKGKSLVAIMIEIEHN